jgi:polygalacturonase
VAKVGKELTMNNCRFPKAFGISKRTKERKNKVAQISLKKCEMRSGKSVKRINNEQLPFPKSFRY